MILINRGPDENSRKVLQCLKTVKFVVKYSQWVDKFEHESQGVEISRGLSTISELDVKIIQAYSILYGGIGWGPILRA